MILFMPNFHCENLRKMFNSTDPFPKIYVPQNIRRMLIFVSNTFLHSLSGFPTTILTPLLTWKSVASQENCIPVSYHIWLNTSPWSVNISVAPPFTEIFVPLGFIAALSNSGISAIRRNQIRWIFWEGGFPQSLFLKSDNFGTIITVIYWIKKAITLFLPHKTSVCLA